MSGFHMPLAPSAAPQWFYCPGSVVMQMYYPGDDTPEAKEGRASHEIGEETTRRFTRGMSALPFSEYKGKFSEDGVPYDIEMYEGAQLYAEVCKGVMIATGVFGGPNIRIEEYVSIDCVHEANGGTPDFSLYDERNRVLHVVDYKYGHRLVEVFENLQLVDYALGLLAYYGIDGLGDQWHEVEFTVVQPRSRHADGPVRSWRCKASDLRAIANGLVQAGHKAMGDNPQCVAGRHCRDCTARQDCPAFNEAVYDAMQFVSDPQPLTTTPDSVATELRFVRRARELIEYKEKALEQQAESYAEAGKVLPGWRMTHTYGRARFKDPEEAIALGELYGVDLRKPVETITPNQAIKAGIDETVISGYIEKPRRGYKLVEDDTTEAKKVFGNG